MRKIMNPFVGIEGYSCFGCSPDNKNGLNLEFYEDGDYVISKWMPDHKFAGYGNIVHGGIISTIMDEVGSWLIFVKLKTVGVTSRMTVDYKKPVYIDNNEINIKSKVIEFNESIAHVNVEAFNKDNVLRAVANIYYFIYPEPIAKRRFHYPGYDAFFKK